MKRSTDEIRYLILKELDEKIKINIENVRQKVNTSLQTIINNVEDLEIFGFVKVNETSIGKRKYREIEITKEGKMFFEKIRKAFEK